MRKWWLQNQDGIVRNLPGGGGDCCYDSLHTPQQETAGTALQLQLLLVAAPNLLRPLQRTRGALGFQPLSRGGLSKPSLRSDIGLQPSAANYPEDHKWTRRDCYARQSRPKGSDSFFFFFSTGKEGPRKPPKEAPKGGCSLEKGLGWRDLDFSALRSTKSPILFHYLSTVHAITRTSAQEPKSLNNGSL